VLSRGRIVAMQAIQEGVEHLAALLERFMCRRRAAVIVGRQFRECLARRRKLRQCFAEFLFLDMPIVCNGFCGDIEEPQRLCRNRRFTVV
jgi:hypothetical protein